MILTNEKVSLEINGRKAIYKAWFTDKPQAGREEAQIVSLAIVINGFRIAAGSYWSPTEIHLQTNEMPNLDALFPGNNHMHVVLDQPYTGIVFETSLLAKPMLNKESKQLFERVKNKKLTSTCSRIIELLESNT